MRAGDDKTDRYPVTPDGRYFVVRGRLWRRSDPALPEDQRSALVADLMAARRAIGAARRAGDDAAEDRAHAAVDAAKRALGERGPVWWTDGAPDLNRHMARTTPYADGSPRCRSSPKPRRNERRAAPLVGARPFTLSALRVSGDYLAALADAPVERIEPSARAADGIRQ